MIITPFQSPALLLLKLKHTSTLRIDFQDIEYSSNINQSKSCAIAIDADDKRKWLPKQFALFSDMWKSESPEHTTLTANYEQLLGNCHSAYDIFAFFGVVELVEVVDLIDVGFVIDEPADFTAHFAVSHLRWRLKHRQPRSLTLILPHIDIIFRTCDNVSFGHAVDWNLQSHLFRFDSGTNGIAEINLSVILLWMWEYCAEFSLSFDLGQLFHVFHVFLIWFGVPEYHAELHAVGFLICEYESSVGKVTPFVIWPDRCTVNCWSCCNSYPESSAFPSDIVDCFSVGYPEIFEMVALAIKKFNNRSLFLILKRASSNSYHGPSGIPPNFSEYHGCINGNGILIFVIFHEDESALLICDA